MHFIYSVSICQEKHTTSTFGSPNIFHRIRPNSLFLQNGKRMEVPYLPFEISPHSEQGSPNSGTAAK